MAARSPDCAGANPRTAGVRTKDHVAAVLDMAATDCIHGDVRTDHLLMYYLEVCHWVGFEPLPEQSIMRALAQKLGRRRRRVDGQQRSFYTMPRTRRPTK
jgi:hypothetical protein